MVNGFFGIKMDKKILKKLTKMVKKRDNLQDGIKMETWK